MLGRAIALGQTGRFAPGRVRLFLELVQGASRGGAAATAYTVAAVRELGALYRREGDLTRARSWFLRYLDEAERLGADFPESEAERDLTRLHLAQVYDASGYHDEAVRLLTELSRGPGPVSAEAQYGLAAAYDGAGARRLAIGEYGATFSSASRAIPAYLPGSAARRVPPTSYTITDPEGLALALQQGWVDELTGVPRRRSPARRGRSHPARPPGLCRVPCAPGGSTRPPTPTTRRRPEARFYLADCLYRLARQRQLEGLSAASDSLHALALQEDALLGESRGWTSGRGSPSCAGWSRWPIPRPRIGDSADGCWRTATPGSWNRTPCPRRASRPAPGR